MTDGDEVSNDNYISREPVPLVTFFVLVLVTYIVKKTMVTKSCKKNCIKYKKNLHFVLLIFSTYKVFFFIERIAL